MTSYTHYPLDHHPNVDRSRLLCVIAMLPSTKSDEVITRKLPVKNMELYGSPEMGYHGQVISKPRWEEMMDGWSWQPVYRPGVAVSPTPKRSAYLIAGIDQHEPSGSIVVLNVGIYSDDHPTIAGWPAMLWKAEGATYVDAQKKCEAALNEIARTAPNLKRLYWASHQYGDTETP